MLSIAVIVLFVLMALCAIVGAIYAYIYFTRINPVCKGHRAVVMGQRVVGVDRGRKHRGKGHRGAGNTAASAGLGGGGDSHRQSVDDDGQPAGPSTHLFLFRKS